MGIKILWQAENRSNDADFPGVPETYGAMMNSRNRSQDPIRKSRCVIWRKRRVRSPTI